MNRHDTNSSPPEGATQGFFYGWVIVAVCLVIMTTAYGVSYSFGVFFKPLQDDFGWSRAATSSIFSFYQMSHNVLGLLAGWATDRYGPRITVALGGIVFGAGLMLTSRVSALWQLYPIYGLLVGLGISAAWSPMLTTVSRWFTKRRGLALGVVTSGIGLGTVIMSPLAGYLISSHGWRMSYFGIGMVALVIILVASLFLRKSPQEKGLLPYGELENGENTTNFQSRGVPFREAIRGRSLWVLLTIFTLVSVGIFMVMTHIVRYAQDSGMPPLAAASILSIVGFASIVGRIVVGAASDRVGVRRTLIACAILQAIIIVWLSAVSGVWEFYLCALFFGFVYGGLIPLFPALTGELFGVGHMGILFGFVTLGAGIGGALGPLMAGYIFDTMGSYSIAFLIAASLSAVSVMLLPALKARYH